jgi:hypothetical protein
MRSDLVLGCVAADGLIGVNRVDASWRGMQLQEPPFWIPPSLGKWAANLSGEDTVPPRFSKGCRSSILVNLKIHKPDNVNMIFPHGQNEEPLLRRLT